MISAGFRKCCESTCRPIHQGLFLSAELGGSSRDFKVHKFEKFCNLSLHRKYFYFSLEVEIHKKNWGFHAEVITRAMPLKQSKAKINVILWELKEIQVAGSEGCWRDSWGWATLRFSKYWSIDSQQDKKAFNWLWAKNDLIWFMFRNVAANL